MKKVLETLEFLRDNAPVLEALAALITIAGFVTLLLFAFEFPKTGEMNESVVVAIVAALLVLGSVVSYRIVQQRKLVLHRRYLKEVLRSLRLHLLNAEWQNLEEVEKTFLDVEEFARVMQAAEERMTRVLIQDSMQEDFTTLPQETSPLPILVNTADRTWGRPTLIIGLGGLGQLVTLQLEKDLYDSFGGDVFSIVKLVCFDTEDDFDISVFSKENKSKRVKGRTHYRMREPNSKRVVDQRKEVFFLKDWLNITGEGVGRVWGRIILLNNVSTVRSVIENQVQTLLSPTIKHKGFSVSEGINVVVVTASSGVVGAGAFIDVGQIVKDSITNISADVPCSVSSVLVLPEVFRAVPEPREMWTTFCLLEELQHLHTSQAQELRNQSFYKGLGIYDNPFDYCYCIDENNGQTYLKSPEVAAGMVTHFIIGLIKQREVHTTTKGHLQNAKGFISSFGLSRLYFPVQTLATLLACRSARSYLTSYQGTVSTTQPRSLANRLLKQMALFPEFTVKKMVDAASVGVAGKNSIKRYSDVVGEGSLEIINEVDKLFRSNLDLVDKLLLEQAQQVSRTFAEEIRKYLISAIRSKEDKKVIEDTLIIVSRVCVMLGTVLDDLYDEEAGQAHHLYAEAVQIKQQIVLGRTRLFTNEKKNLARYIECRHDELHIRLKVRSIDIFSKVLEETLEYLTNEIKKLGRIYLFTDLMVECLVEWEKSLQDGLSTKDETHFAKSILNIKEVQLILDQIYDELFVHSLQKDPFSSIDEFKTWIETPSLLERVDLLLKFYWNYIVDEIGRVEKYSVEHYVSNPKQVLDALWHSSKPHCMKAGKIIDQTSLYVYNKYKTKFGAKTIQSKSRLTVISTDDRHCIQLIRTVHGLTINDLNSCEKYKDCYEQATQVDKEWAKVFLPSEELLFHDALDELLQLLRLLESRWSYEDIQNVCMSMKIEYENIASPSTSKVEQIRKLLEYCRRRNQLSELKRVIVKERPDLEKDM